MLDQGHGSIVNIGSTVIVRGSARAPQYAAAKYGILGATKSYAQAFAPGFIETAATLGRQDWKSGRGDQLRKLTPRGHIRGGPAELAGTALFLATDDAAHRPRLVGPHTCDRRALLVRALDACRRQSPPAGRAT